MKINCLSKYCLIAFSILEASTRVSPFIVEYQKGIGSNQDVQYKIVNGKEVEPHFKYPFQVCTGCIKKNKTLFFLTDFQPQ